MSHDDDPIGLTIVAAMGRRREIGRDGSLPFRLKSDMMHFRDVTGGRPVVMGRKTWDSLPKKPLPGRPNVIVSRNPDFEARGACVFPSIGLAAAAARALADNLNVEEVCIIGGGQIYAAALPLVKRMWLTEVDAETEADVFFPAFDEREWKEVSAVRHEADADNEAAFVIRELVRR